MIFFEEKKRKGILLSGGAGSRLYPLTGVLSKQLLPVYNKPMVYYSLATLFLSGIRDILLITTPGHLGLYKALLGDGGHWGVRIEYCVQPSPDGLAQAFILAEEFLDGCPSALVLGDNITFGAGLISILSDANVDIESATIFLKDVPDPERFGIAEISEKNIVVSIEEKPSNPKSSNAITGLYFLDENASNYAKLLTPSARGELEIIDLLDVYLRKDLLKARVLT